MTATVKFGCLITGKYHKPDVKGSVTVIFPRSLNVIDIETEINTTPGVPTIIEMTIPNKICPLVPVIIMWKVERQMCGTEHVDVMQARGQTPPLEPVFWQTYRANAGYSRMLIKDIITEGGCESSIVDVSPASDVVGTARLIVAEVVPETIWVGPGTHSRDYLIPASVSKYTDHFSIDREMRLSALPTNVDYLPRCAFTSIRLPVGDVPMWSFVSNVNHGRLSSSVEDTEVLFQRLHDATVPFIKPPAIFRRFDDPNAFEFIAEMLLFHSRHILYVKDGSLGKREEKGTDEWSFALQGMLMNILAGDCEDITALTFELCLMFQKARFNNPALAWHQRADSVHIPLFCLCGLRLPGGQFTYHALVIKLPRTVFAVLMEGKAVESGTDNGIWPVLYETTAVTSSYWKHDISDISRGTDYRNTQLALPIQPGKKIPSNLVIEQRIYMHLLTAFSPDLGSSPTTGMPYICIDFMHNGAIGVPMNQIMTGDYSNVRVVASTIQSIYMRDTLPRMYEGMPRLKPIHSNIHLYKSVKVVNTTIPPRPSLMSSSLGGGTDYYFRMADWSNELHESIKRAVDPNRVYVSIIKLTKDFSGVRVTVQ